MSMTTDQMYKSRPVYIAFFIYAFALGSLFPRIGDLQKQLGVEEGTLGLALIGLPLGVQISLLLADKILKYFNIRHVMLIGIPVVGLAFYIGLGLLGRLMPALPVFFFGMPAQITLQFWIFTLTFSGIMMVFLKNFQDSYSPFIAP